MLDQAKIEALVSNVEGALAELKSAMSGESGEGEMEGEQTEVPEMESEEGGMPQGKAKVMAMEEEEPPEIVKRMAGMR